MGKAYSSDLRERVLRHIEAGHTRRDAAARFGVSPSFAIKLDRRVRETGSSEPSRQGRPPGAGPLAAFRDYLIGLVEARPDITLRELVEPNGERHHHEDDPAARASETRREAAYHCAVRSLENPDLYRCPAP